MKCPLCGCEQIKEVEDVNIDIIKKHYKSQDFDADYLFKDDKLVCYQCKNCKTKFFRPIVEGDDAYYSHLQREDWYFLHEDKTEFEYSKKYIKPTDKVLDIGSGRGVFKKHINCEFYQGLEFSHKAIELAKKDGINVINESIQQHCKSKPEFYDVVVIFQVLEHIVNINDFMESSLKCLKKGGKLIIAVPNNNSFIKYSTNNFLNMPPHHQNLFNETSLKKLANLYNIKIEKIFKEKVSNIHKDWFYETLKCALTKKLYGQQIRLCDNSDVIRPKGVKKFIIKWCKSFAKLFRIHKILSGHSIIFVYKK